VFIEDMDRKLVDAFLAIERSKRTASLVNEELDRVKRRLKTEDTSSVKHFSFEEENYYCLPYGSYLFNSSNRLHKRNI
jgi:hypothetical protein